MMQSRVQQWAGFWVLTPEAASLHAPDTHLHGIECLMVVARVLCAPLVAPDRQVIIVTSSLMKDMNSNVDLYRSNAVRVLCQIVDGQLLAQIERYLKQAVVDKRWAGGRLGAGSRACRAVRRSATAGALPGDGVGGTRAVKLLQVAAGVEAWEADGLSWVVAGMGAGNLWERWCNSSCTCGMIRWARRQWRMGLGAGAVADCLAPGWFGDGLLSHFSQACMPWTACQRLSTRLRTQCSTTRLHLDDTLSLSPCSPVVAASVLCSAVHLMAGNSDIIKRWVNEVQEAVQVRRGPRVLGRVLSWGVNLWHQPQ